MPSSHSSRVGGSLGGLSSSSVSSCVCGFSSSPPPVSTSLVSLIGPLPSLDVPAVVSSLKSAGLSPSQVSSALASALSTYERVVYDYRCMTVGPSEPSVSSMGSSPVVSASPSLSGDVSASPRRSRSFRRNARRRSAASSASSKNMGAVFAGGNRFPSITPSEVGTKPYFEPFSDAMPRHVRGYQSGTSFGIYPTSSRGSSGSPSHLAPPDGKCYLRIVAAGHRTAARELLSDYPLVSQVLAAPAVMFSVDALYTVRAVCDSLTSIHASVEGDHSLYAILARYALMHKRNLALPSSRWDGTLLQALVARSDFATVSRECNYLYTFDAVLGGTERSSATSSCAAFSFATASAVGSSYGISSASIRSTDFVDLIVGYDSGSFNYISSFVKSANNVLMVVADVVDWSYYSGLYPHARLVAASQVPAGSTVLLADSVSSPGMFGPDFVLSLLRVGVSRLIYLPTGVSSRDSLKLLWHKCLFELGLARLYDPVTRVVSASVDRELLLSAFVHSLRLIS